MSGVTKHVATYVKKVIQVMVSVEQRFKAYASGRISEAAFTVMMEAWDEDMGRIYRLGSNGPMPTPEDAALEQSFQNMLAHFDNLRLYYAHDTFLARTPENRRQLFESSLKEFRKSLGKCLAIGGDSVWPPHALT